MSNQELVNQIKAGIFSDQKDAFEVIQNKELFNNDSFKRTIKNEYVFEFNKSNPDHAVLKALEDFHIDLIAYVEKKF